MDPTQRFSTRVENYVKYRPGYPKALIGLLQAECGLAPGCSVADTGSGTGILSRLFLENGNRVYGIEPNREMREAAERLLEGYAGFVSIAASAECTSLEGHSIDFVTAGQAFHWFDPQATRAEFARILRPRGWVVLVWNDRRTGSTPFLAAYERLLREYGTDYNTVNHKLIGSDVFDRFFAGRSMRCSTFENRQRMDLAGLRGRLLSSSYAPELGHPRYEEMLDELQQIFQAYQVNGTINLDYDTMVYFGRLSPA